MLDLLAAIVADPTPLPLWGVLSWAAVLYPLGFMLGSGCCCKKCSACAAGSIVFTYNNGGAFTIPSQGNVEIDLYFLSITNTGGTGVFSGVTGWEDENGDADTQALWLNVNGPASQFERDLEVRFNRFTLVGTCTACGQLITPSSDDFGGNTYPSAGRGFIGPSFVRAGVDYGLPDITFDVPGCEDQAFVGSVSIEANSGGGYTIRLQAGPLP